jgi:20S proteasome alpha/beta subunit
MDQLRSILSDQIEEDLEPEGVARVISHLMYSSKYICTPVVAGVGSNGPYLCSMDGLGAQSSSTSFAAVGTSSAALLTACEASYSPQERPECAIKDAHRIIRSSLQRDVLSGCRISSYTLLSDGDIFVKEMEVPDV